MSLDNFLGYSARTDLSAPPPVNTGLEQPQPARPTWQRGRNQQLIAALRARSMQNAETLFARPQQVLGQLPAQGGAGQVTSSLKPADAPAGPALDPQFDPAYWQNWANTHY